RRGPYWALRSNSGTRVIGVRQYTTSRTDSLQINSKRPGRPRDFHRGFEKFAGPKHRDPGRALGEVLLAVHVAVDRLAADLLPEPFGRRRAVAGGTAREVRNLLDRAGHGPESARLFANPARGRRTTQEFPPRDVQNPQTGEHSQEEQEPHAGRRGP